MKYLFFFLLFLPFGLLAQESPRYKKPAPTDDPRIFALTKRNVAGLGYKTPAQVADQIRLEARWDSLSEAEIVAKIKEIPAGGHLRMGVASYTKEAVMLENFTIVVRNENGEEIFNRQLSPSPPGKTVDVKPIWGNLGIVPLENPPKTGYIITITDRFVNKRYEYLMKME